MKIKMSKTLTLLLVLSVVTVGCGGGNMKGNTPPPNNGLTTPPTNIVGTWTGTLTDSFGNNGEPMTVEFVSEQGTAPYTTGAGLMANVNVADVVGGGNCALKNITEVQGQITPRQSADRNGDVQPYHWRWPVRP